MLAVRLASRIEAAFGITVPLAAFFEHATVALLASMIRAGGADAAWTPMVAMSGGGKGAPLFLFPGAGGNVLAFDPLVRRLAGTRPIYGLQAVGLDGRTAPLTDVRTMASVVVPAIETAAGAFPVLLAGHSFGGPVAYEVAQQLRARGTPVAWLGIFDTPAPIFDAEPVTAQWTEADWVRRIGNDIEIMTGVTLGVDEALRATPAADADAAFTVLADRLTATGWWPADAPRRALAGYLAVYRANLTTHYRATRAEYPVPTTLFAAHEQDHATTSAAVLDVQRQDGWGWRSLMSDVSITRVRGDHLTMLTEPHVSGLAAALRAALVAME
jgi:thioesterase domain-containing protein